MKCVVINGSPHKGNTYKLAQIVKKRMSEHGRIEFEEFHLGQYDMPFCKGCFCCFERGEHKCPHFEAVGPLAKAIESADALIVLSPAYSIAPTALLKNLIDHLSYYYHRSRFFTKKALVITSTAGAGAKPTARYIRDVLLAWGFNRVHCFSPALHAGIGYSPDAKMESKLYRLADEFYADVAGGRLHRPKLKRVALYNVWRALAASDSQTFDGQYWHQNSLMETTFAPGIPRGPLGRLTGAIVFGMIKALMKKQRA